MANNFDPSIYLKDFNELLTDLSESIQYAKHLGKKTGVIYIISKPDITHDQLQQFYNQDHPHTALYKIKKNEYCLLMRKFNTPEEIANITKKLSKIFPNVKLGIALYPHASDKSERLVTMAREACTTSNKAFDFYKKDIDSKVKQKLRLENDIHHALSNNELLLHYQPIIDLKSGKIVSIEALLRWQHPELGELNPLDFIPIVEEQDLMIDFGEWIFETAFEHYKEWGNKGNINISINVAPTQILSFYFVKRMENRIQQSGMNWQHIQIELTENDYIHDIEESSKKLSELADKGLKIVLDDYGTGFSSMKYLLNLPISNIKIDKCYISSIESYDNSRQLIKSTVQMAHDLGLTVTAEGIETQAQVDLLKIIGCDFGQGFLFSKPLKHSEIKALLKKSLLISLKE